MLADPGPLRKSVEMVVAEIVSVVASVDFQDPVALDDAVQRANRIFVSGQGRSGLVGRAYAHRLMHIALVAHVVGETTTPAVGVGDLLVAISGSGSTTTTVHHAAVAQAAGATVLGVVPPEGGELGGRSDIALRVGTRPKTDQQSVQFATTLFCQATQILLDGTVTSCRASSSRRTTISGRGMRIWSDDHRRSGPVARPPTKSRL